MSRLQLQQNWAPAGPGRRTLPGLCHAALGDQIGDDARDGRLSDTRKSADLMPRNGGVSKNSAQNRAAVLPFDSLEIAARDSVRHASFILID
jgi:hypothetical protein